MLPLAAVISAVASETSSELTLGATVTAPATAYEGRGRGGRAVTQTPRRAGA